GQGTPVVLLHGWPQTWYEWRLLMPLLADQYLLVAPDLRGVGASSRPADGYDQKTVAGDIWQLMHHPLGHPRATAGVPQPGGASGSGVRRRGGWWRSASPPIMRRR